jgi:hypothetical protein
MFSANPSRSDATDLHPGFDSTTAAEGGGEDDKDKDNGDGDDEDELTGIVDGPSVLSYVDPARTVSE